jgi:hypothetical protein
MYATVAGGQVNEASGESATVGGGAFNTATGRGTNVSGGEDNAAASEWSTVGGGSDNTASAWHSTVGGGWGNIASGAEATVAGGISNDALGAQATVPGGWSNSAGGDYSLAAGCYAKADHEGAFVWADSAWPVTWEFHSVVENEFAVRARGGVRFVTAIDGTGGPTAGISVLAATNTLSTVGAGSMEFHVNATRALRLVPEANGPSILGGHPENYIEPGADSAAVSGGGATGEPNRVYDSFGTVGGGRWNQAGVSDGGTGSQMYGTVGGGYGNYALNTGATVAGGITNFASGNYAAVPGGHENTAAGDYSLAAGRRAKANHQGAFVWGDSTDADVTSTGVDSFTVRAAGGATFYSDAAMTTGVELPAGAGAWAALSDRNAKENFRDEDAEAVLAKLAAIPMQSWNYKTQDDSIRHMGPVAQDFFEAFGLGGSEKRISTVDADGVALAAIKALEERTRELREENADLRRANGALERRVLEVERALALEVRE